MLNSATIFLIILAMLTAYLIGVILIPYLKRLHFGQHERLEGPNSHLAKEGTPTFGGFIFLLPFFGFTLAYTIWLAVSEKYLSRDFLVTLFVIFLTAALGFLDDYVKVRKDKEGLSPKQKTQYLVAIFSLYALYFVTVSEQASLGLGLAIPGLGCLAFNSWLGKIIFALFIVFYLYCCSNAVNITDGVDGLCSSVTVIVLLGIEALLATLSAKLSANLVAVKWPLGLIHLYQFATLLLVASLIGFLMHNKYPAKVFMGDLGSLSLGTTVAIFLLQFGWAFAFLAMGIIYWVEILSVLIQVTYFRKTGGKRIFKMTPIHHHFELSNWSERKIVFVFSLVTLIGVAIAYSLWR